MKASASDLPDVVFYGCIGEPGHYTYARGIGRHWYYELGEALGFDRNANKIDCGLTPKGPQQQGKALLHSLNGWTVLAWWDRSGPDHRFGGNSVLAVRGDHTFEQMIARLGADFPDVAARQPPVFLAPEGK